MESEASENSRRPQQRRQQHSDSEVSAPRPRGRDRVAAAGRFAPFVLLQSASQDGARLLTHLLDAHPDVRAAGEIVRKEYDPEEIEGWFRSFHPSSSKPFVRKHQDNEHQCAVGLRLSRAKLRGAAVVDGVRVGNRIDHESGEHTYDDHADRVMDTAHLLSNLGGKLVCVVRGNYVKHALSQWDMRARREHCGDALLLSRDCANTIKRTPFPPEDYEWLRDTIALLRQDLADSVRICVEVSNIAVATIIDHVDVAYGHERRDPSVARPVTRHELLNANLGTLQNLLGVRRIDLWSAWEATRDRPEVPPTADPLDLSAYMADFDSVKKWFTREYGEDSVELKLLLSTST